ncbi:MAG: DUF5711 family protein, partial [Fulvivirga sp.]|nr:DUF5711 family protein [Fulvivirga sp.]
MLRSICLHLLFVCLVGNLTAQQDIPRIVIDPAGHSGKIYNVLFTPDGEQVISISEDKTIRIWNANTGELVNKFESQVGNGYQGMLYASSISPDGKILAVSGYPVITEESNYIIFIDLEKGKQVATALGHDNVINALDFSGDGKYIASGSDDGTILVWEMGADETIPRVAEINVGVRITGLSFNDKTNQLAVAADTDEVLVYDLSGLAYGKKKFPLMELKKHKGMINKVKFSPDGTYLATSSLANELFLWGSDGSLEKEFGHIKNIINAITFSH